MNTKDAEVLFFTELKQYNSTNFKALLNRCEDNDDPIVLKAYSSAITRYFIFAEKHPEIEYRHIKMVYYKLKLDLVAQYFSEYPSASPELLKPFKGELKKFVEESEVVSYA